MAVVSARLRPVCQGELILERGIDYRKVANVARFQVALVSASRQEVSESIVLG